MSRYEETEHRRNAVIEQIDKIMIRRRKIERFIESVKDLPELITAFDESLWAGTGGQHDGVQQRPDRFPADLRDGD